jgi:ABC-type cobalt transport system substrate-binding protein
MIMVIIMMLIIIIIIIIIQFNSVLYYLCAEPTATRPITGTAQYRSK